MAYTGEVAARPLTIGCLQTFDLSWKESVIRTDSENSAFIKTRRRTTAPLAVADCSVTLKADVVQDFMNWYTVACRCGAVPTRIKVPPLNKEQIWRFSAAPKISWIDPKAAQVTWSMEKLPMWVD
jgi:hypothetical protein